MTQRGRPSHPDILTPAEWRIAEGVRHGLTNPAIAAKCDLSVNAVKFHVSSILSKLGLSSRRELQQWGGIRADSALAAVSAKSGPAHLSMGQVSRATSNLDRMAVWLRDVVGLTEVMRFAEAAFFDCGDVRIYLCVGDPAANSIFYLRTSDVEAETERLRVQGVPIKSAPHRIHVHANGTEKWMAFFTDPDGGHWGLMSEVVPQAGEEK